VLGLLEVAGVEADAVGAGLDGGEGEAVAEVDVGDQGDADLLADGGQRLGGRAVGHGDADDLAAALFELAGLADRRRHVGGRRVGHRLHGDGRIPADGHTALMDDAGLAAVDHGIGRRDT